MTELTIRRWHNHFLAGQAAPNEPTSHWQSGLANLEIGAELDVLAAPDEWILIRKMGLAARHHAQGDETEGETQWHRALAQELQRVLAGGISDHLVRYRHARAGLADMLYRGACGDLSRAWAWHQMGLLPPGAPVDQPAEILEAAVLHLLAEPTSIWPLFSRLLMAEAGTSAFTFVLQKLPAARFTQLLAVCPQTSVYQGRLTHPIERRVGNLTLTKTPLVAVITRWILIHPWVALHHRPELKVLLAAAAQSADGLINTARPSLIASLLGAASNWIDHQLAPCITGGTQSYPEFHRPGHQQTHRERRRPLELVSRQISPPLPPTGIEEPEHPLATARILAEAELALATGLPIAPDLPDQSENRASQWAGLIFVLNLLPASTWEDAFEALAQNPDMPADAGRQLLWHLACDHLLIPPLDPAVRAFCGGWLPSPAHLNSEQRLRLATALEPLALRLLRALELKLAVHPDLSLGFICQRPAYICFEPGWIEVRLPLEQADIRLNHLALDLNPGWLAWLGCVVRISHV